MIVRSKKTIICIFILILIAAGFFLLTDFLLAANRLDVVKYTEEYIDVPSPSGGMFSLSVWQEQDMFHRVNIEGWAFWETEKENPNKYIRVILVGEDGKQLEIKTQGVPRSDVRSAFINDKKIQGVHHGIFAQFSPASLDNGKYEIWIYCNENDEAHGIIETGRWFEKEGREFIEIAAPEAAEEASIAVAIEATVGSDSVRYYIDSASQNEGHIDIQGWAYIQEQDAAANAICLQITSAEGVVSYYETRPVLREDVGNHFNDDRYDQSGFSAKIPIEAFSEGKNTILPVIGEERYTPTSPYFFTLAS